MGVDIVLGPEMRSTGEVMGIDADFALAFAKAQLAAGSKLPMGQGFYQHVFASHKQRMIEPARRLKSLGYQLSVPAAQHVSSRKPALMWMSFARFRKVVQICWT
jgi:hypothetical protein